ncbi:hypothetical protein KAU33_09990 [Candidatus Dependentiae bacterium]|nr:hypothetical protein [Candidatus Dependentiae bacterium]
MNMFLKDKIKLKLIFLKKFINGNKWFRNRSQLFQKFEKKINLINRYYSIDNINWVEITGFKNKSLEKVFHFGFDEFYSTGLNKPIEINIKYQFDIIGLNIYFGLTIPEYMDGVVPMEIFSDEFLNNNKLEKSNLDPEEEIALNGKSGSEEDEKVLKQLKGLGYL